MFEVEITNYESITHTKLKVEGFTTLIGRNFLGKSSVLRAINAALTNKEGTEFISWGKTFCEVHLIFPDLDILWHKEEGNNFYIVNGKEYNKIGRGDPPKEILDAGFRPLMVGDQKLYLNYAVQFFPLFLVNKRDSKSADILTSVYGLDRIYKAIDLCNKEQRANSDLLRLREKDLALVENGLEKFKPFPDIFARLPELKNRKKELSASEEEIKKIRQWDVSVRSVATAVKKLKPVSEVQLPKDAQIAKDITDYENLVKYNTQLTWLMDFLRKTKPVQDIVIPDKWIAEIKGLFAEYQQLLIWNMTYKKISEEVRRLEKIKDIQIPTSKIDMEDIPKLQSMHENVRTLATEVKGYMASIASITTEVEAIQKEIDSFDMCPLCGAKRG
jgi:hypothetical protein